MSNYENFADSYDILTSNVDYEKRGAYFHEILVQNHVPEGILVDLACGTGSLSEYFARLNYDVIGVDASADMLEIAQNKKYESGSDIMYLNQTMQTLDLYGTIDAVICALDSINHLLTPEEVQTAFDRVSLFLNPGGIFVFDVNSVYKHTKILAGNTFVYDCGDTYCVWQNSLLENCMIEINLDIFEYQPEDDCYLRFQENFCERAYPHEQILEMIEKAGLTLLQVYAGDTVSPPQPDTQRLVYITRK